MLVPSAASSKDPLNQIFFLWWQEIWIEMIQMKQL